MYMKQTQKKFRGSVLVYTLILLTIVLMAAISMATVSITNQRSVFSGDKSNNAFQSADSGAQIVVAAIKKAPNKSDPISTLGSCSGSTLTGPTLAGGGTYKVTFSKSDDSPLTCSDHISDVATIKSVGAYADTTRAVQVAVAQSGGAGITGGCTVDNHNNEIIFRWGVGCKAPFASENTCHDASETGFDCGTASIDSGTDSPPAYTYFCLCVHE